MMPKFLGEVNAASRPQPGIAGNREARLPVGDKRTGHASIGHALGF
jgi:hypothetical protein